MKALRELDMQLSPDAPEVTSSAADGPSVVCQSCDHANPAGSNFCNQCGMPVHFEPCGRCEAINRRGAAVCYKCGSALSSTVRPRTAAAAVPIADSPPPQAAEPIVVNVELPEEDARPAAPVRGTGVRAAGIALGIALIAVLAYIASEHPESFGRAIDAITQRGNAGSDASRPAEVRQAVPPPAPTLPTPEHAGAPAGSPASTDDPPAVADRPRSVEPAPDTQSAPADAVRPAPAARKSPPPSNAKASASRPRQTDPSPKPPPSSACDQGILIPGCR